MGIEILGMGHALPEGVLTNQDLEQMVDTSDQWIIERTGIRERRIVKPGTANSDLCAQAALAALKQAGLPSSEIGLIVVATVTPDMVFPSTACLVQEKIQAFNAAAFDLQAGCTGFIYAMDLVKKYVQAGGCRYALIIGADLLTRITDYTDRNTCVLFGDGAGAAVLGLAEDNAGIIETLVGADGRGHQLLHMPAGGSLQPASQETVAQRLHYINMNGNDVFRFASRIIVEVSKQLLDRAGLDYNDVDLFVPHQANLRIIRTAMKRMKIAEDKTMINIDRYGNMSAASIPVALSEAYSSGRIKEGDVVLMVAFGAGLTYGGALVRWGRLNAGD
ncbi:beta-ketoacyl-ACP synthase III [Syntrophomonas erecta]